jgi:N-acetylneuraminate synthase/N,N'-diacetyllegionaminate synthase
MIRAGMRSIGADSPCFVAAEIGINHNGDIELAQRMIEAAARCGADGVKFQNYRTEDFVGDRALSYSYSSQGRAVSESQFALFKRCELPLGSLRRLADTARDCGVEFFSTPTGTEGIAELLDARAALVKNGSDFLTHLDLVRAWARCGLPTVLSTGMATEAEIDDAVAAFRTAGGTQLVLLHCTSAYPTAPRDVHLHKLPALAARYGCPVGLSDHTQGINAALGALALGAVFIEKHFTTDRNLPGPDQAMSCDPTELRELVSAVRELHSMLGSHRIGPTAAEAVSRESFRLSCVARADLDAGSILERSSVAFRRPGTGMPPKAIDWIAGKALARAVSRGSLLEPEDFA